MKLKSILVITGIALTGCATSIDPEIVNQKEKVVFNNFVSCLKHFAPIIDDKKSDPASIALALTSACSVQYDAITQFYCDYKAANYNQCRLMRQHRDTLQSQIQSGIDAVILNRTRK